MSIHYERNYLSEVVIKADFQPQIAALQTDLPEAIREAFTARAPRLERRESMSAGFELSVEMNQAEPRIRNDVDRFPQWVFRTDDDAIVIFLDKQALTISFRKYEGFERASEMFSTLLNGVVAHVESVELSRLGLRYVNNISVQEVGPTIWHKYIATPLIGAFDFLDKPTEASRVFQIIEYNYGSSQLRFQFGMPNPDYPATIRQKVFVLDYDAYQQAILGTAEAVTILTELHERIHNLFERSVTGELRAMMSDGQAG